MTKEERHLWYDFFKYLPATIKRQKIIGPYILDFYCASAKTAIESDGPHHLTEKGHISDALRDNYLSARGIKVLRYSNYDINNSFSDVCADILRHIIPVS